MIKEYRKKHGYTQEKLAELLNISARQYQRIETNEKEISMKLFKRIITILDINDEDILSFFKDKK